MKIFRCSIILICILGACQNPTYQGFKEAGRAKTRSLIAELKMIKTKDQLLEHRQKLKHQFDELASLHDQVLTYAKNHPKDELPILNKDDHELSSKLRLEILRVYRLDGGREILDTCRSHY